jgi:hypothetical protein
MSEYEFAFRGLLSEEALDHAGRASGRVTGLFDPDIAVKLSIELLDEQFTTPARQMAAVYVAVAAFENSARELVTKVLVDAVGESWWEDAVSEKIRARCKSRQEDEEKNRYHTQRGEAPINYTELNDLLSIIKQNWESFEPFLPSQEWTGSIFAPIERSRNVIMHSGVLDLEDIERVGINVRDWVKQVGG